MADVEKLDTMLIKKLKEIEELRDWIRSMAYVENKLYEERLFGQEDYNFNARKAIDILLEECHKCRLRKPR